MHRFCLLFLILFGVVRAAGDSAPAEAQDSGQYRLFPHDGVSFGVQGEPDVTADRKVDGKGMLDVPYLGPVKVSGLTIPDAEALIAAKYKQAEIYTHPEVVLAITDYVPREASVLGSVGKAGKIQFPPEASHMTIVDAIAAAGDFTRLANTHAVTLTREDDHGERQTFTFDVGKALSGHGNDDSMTFEVLPGDVINVPERMF